MSDEFNENDWRRFLKSVGEDPDRPGFHRFAVTDEAHEKNRLDYIAWLNRRKIYR